MTKAHNRNCLMGLLLLCLTSHATATDRIDVEVTTHLGDQQVYQQGDEISFLVSIDRDAYLLVIYQDAKGNLIQLLPNLLIENSLYKQGMFLAIPSAKSPFVFNIQPPFGQESIWVFAASEVFPELSGKPLENGATLLEGTLQNNVTYLRDSLQKMGAAFGESKTIIITQPK